MRLLPRNRKDDDEEEVVLKHSISKYNLDTPGSPEDSDDDDESSDDDSESNSSDSSGSSSEEEESESSSEEEEEDSDDENEPQEQVRQARKPSSRARNVSSSSSGTRRSNRPPLIPRNKSMRSRQTTSTASTQRRRIRRPFKKSPRLSKSSSSADHDKATLRTAGSLVSDDSEAISRTDDAKAAADALGRDLEEMGYNLDCDSFITKGDSSDNDERSGEQRDERYDCGREPETPRRYRYCDPVEENRQLVTPQQKTPFSPAEDSSAAPMWTKSLSQEGSNSSHVTNTSDKLRRTPRNLGLTLTKSTSHQGHGHSMSPTKSTISTKSFGFKLSDEVSATKSYGADDTTDDNLYVMPTSQSTDDDTPVAGSVSGGDGLVVTGSGIQDVQNTALASNKNNKKQVIHPPVLSTTREDEPEKEPTWLHMLKQVPSHLGLPHSGTGQKTQEGEEEKSIPELLSRSQTTPQRELSGSSQNDIIPPLDRSSSSPYSVLGRSPMRPPRRQMTLDSVNYDNLHKKKQNPSLMNKYHNDSSTPRKKTPKHSSSAPKRHMNPPSPTPRRAPTPSHVIQGLRNAMKEATGKTTGPGTPSSPVYIEGLSFLNEGIGSTVSEGRYLGHDEDVHEETQHHENDDPDDDPIVLVVGSSDEQTRSTVPRRRQSWFPNRPHKKSKNVSMIETTDEVEVIPASTTTTTNTTPREPPHAPRSPLARLFSPKKSSEEQQQQQPETGVLQESNNKKSFVLPADGEHPNNRDGMQTFTAKAEKKSAKARFKHLFLPRGAADKKESPSKKFDRPEIDPTDEILLVQNQNVLDPNFDTSKMSLEQKEAIESMRRKTMNPNVLRDVGPLFVPTKEDESLLSTMDNSSVAGRRSLATQHDHIEVEIKEDDSKKGKKSGKGGLLSRFRKKNSNDKRSGDGVKVSVETPRPRQERKSEKSALVEDKVGRAVASNGGPPTARQDEPKEPNAVGKHRDETADDYPVPQLLAPPPVSTQAESPYGTPMSSPYHKGVGGGDQTHGSTEAPGQNEAAAVPEDGLVLVESASSDARGLLVTEQAFAADAENTQQVWGASPAQASAANSQERSLLRNRSITRQIACSPRSKASKASNSSRKTPTAQPHPALARTWNDFMQLFCEKPRAPGADHAGCSTSVAGMGTRPSLSQSSFGACGLTMPFLSSTPTGVEAVAGEDPLDNTLVGAAEFPRNRSATGARRPAKLELGQTSTSDSEDSVNVAGELGKEKNSLAPLTPSSMRNHGNRPRRPTLTPSRSPLRRPTFRRKSRASKRTQNETLDNSTIPSDEGFTMPPTHSDSKGDKKANDEKKVVQGNLSPRAEEASMANAWMEITDASAVVERALDRIETVKSNESNADRVMHGLMSMGSTDSPILEELEESLMVLKKHAQRLGVRESDLLLAVKSDDVDSVAEDSIRTLTFTEELMEAFHLVRNPVRKPTLRKHKDGFEARRLV